MVETIYRVNGKEFYDKSKAEEYENVINRKLQVHCASCNEITEYAEDADFEVEFYDFNDNNEISGSVTSKGTKYLCPQCGYKFKHQLEEYKKLIEKLFDDFNLRKTEEKPNSDSDFIKSIIDIDNPDSMISKYVKQKEEEILNGSKQITNSNQV